MKPTKKGPCRHRGSDHVEYVCQGETEVSERPVMLCRLAGRYLPRSSCGACVHYQAVDPRAEVPPT